MSWVDFVTAVNKYNNIIDGNSEISQIPCLRTYSTVHLGLGKPNITKNNISEQ